MNLFKTLTLVVLSLFINSGFAQGSILENNNWLLNLNENGTIKFLLFKKSNQKFLFNEDNFVGPSWYFQRNGKIVDIEDSNATKQTKTSYHKKDPSLNRYIYSFEYDNLELDIEYKDEQGKLLILATVKNHQQTPFRPDKLGIRLGIDTYMEVYPKWEEKLFPTLLRSEKTHFWGYFMSPLGKILSISSPDPIASWSHNYSKSWGNPPYLYNGHRITSVNLDLINRLPLPKRHPQNLWQILPGEEKSFKIYLDEVDNLEGLSTAIRNATKAPFIGMTLTSCEPEEIFDFWVESDTEPQVIITSPTGKDFEIKGTLSDSHTYKYSFHNTNSEGLYFIKALGVNGKISEATVYVRKPYSWYMQQAMKAVLEYPQKASKSHTESWYGLYTIYAGGKHFKNNPYIEKADQQFLKIFPKIFDEKNHVPIDFHLRIQNTSAMIGILVDRYQLFGDLSDLEKAVGLSEFLLESQTADGAYRSDKTHYTSVLYIAKSLMELMEAIEPLRFEDQYKQQYDLLYASVTKAMDELVKNKTNIETEGELTFEDGMISCSALQLAQFALLQTDEKAKEKYKNAAIEFIEQHECLEQLVIPDARMRSGSLRFWEAQYDVLMDNNFLNSPHGWSSWSTYAQYYLYLLTGEPKYLEKTFNGLDAAMQMIDHQNGDLRWAFMVNPHVEVTQINKNIDGAIPLDFQGVHYHALEHPNSNYIMGEAYVDMVSDWFYANANDNDVHEHFKCLEEVALDKCFVLEKSNGEFVTYNCTVEKYNNRITIIPSEKIIQKVHLNLKSDYKVVIEFTSGQKINKVNRGMSWVKE